MSLVLELPRIYFLDLLFPFLPPKFLVVYVMFTFLSLSGPSWILKLSSVSFLVMSLVKKGISVIILPQDAVLFLWMSRSMNLFIIFSVQPHLQGKSTSNEDAQSLPLPVLVPPYFFDHVGGGGS